MYKALVCLAVALLCVSANAAFASGPRLLKSILHDYGTKPGGYDPGCFPQPPEDETPSDVYDRLFDDYALITNTYWNYDHRIVSFLDTFAFSDLRNARIRKIVLTITYSRSKDSPIAEEWSVLPGLIWSPAIPMPETGPEPQAMVMEFECACPAIEENKTFELRFLEATAYFMEMDSFQLHDARLDIYGTPPRTDAAVDLLLLHTL